MPMRWKGFGAGLLAFALALPCAGRVHAAPEYLFDAAHSRFGFELRTSWGKALQGNFPRFDGQVAVLPDGHHQVHLRLFTASVEIDGHSRYTDWARGEHFFGASRYPVVMFVSDPYDPAMLKDGGELAGQLSIRGIMRPKTLTVAPAECERPGLDCDVVATGAISRSDYDMDDWKLAINDRVVFVLRTRLREKTP